MNIKVKGALIAAALLAPTAALAAPGIVTASVGLRAGPGPRFPMVDRVPGGAHVNIHGCLRGDAWCDVSWSGDRGWVSSRYLRYRYRERYVYLPDYVDVIDVPVVPFVLNTYWSEYYSGRPWYHRRAYWSNYWQSHANVATQGPAVTTGRVGRTETRTGVNETGAGLVERHGQTIDRRGRTADRTMIRERGQTRLGSAPAVRERMSHVNGAERHFRGQRNALQAQQPFARGHREQRFSTAPAGNRAAPQISRPTIAHGSPLNAHAQMSPPHAAPAPHFGGRAPANATPHAGGGGHGPVGGPPGRQRH